MKHKVIVSFIVDEEESDMAEMEVESLVCDALGVSRGAVEDYEIVKIEEIEEETDDL